MVKACILHVSILTRGVPRPACTYYVDECGDTGMLADAVVMVILPPPYTPPLIARGSIGFRRSNRVCSRGRLCSVR